jgi:hypothetical protein
LVDTVLVRRNLYSRVFWLAPFLLYFFLVHPSIRCHSRCPHFPPHLLYVSGPSVLTIRSNLAPLSHSSTLPSTLTCPFVSSSCSPSHPPLPPSPAYNTGRRALRWFARSTNRPARRSGSIPSVDILFFGSFSFHPVTLLRYVPYTGTEFFPISFPTCPFGL